MNLVEKLKAALKKAGLSEELATIINITSEDQIEGTVKLLQSTRDDAAFDIKKVIESEDFGEFIEKEGVEEVLKNSKSLRTKFDQKVTDSTKKFKTKFFKKVGYEGEDEFEEDEEGKKSKTGDSELAKELKKLNERLDGIEKEKTKAKKSGDIMTALKGSKVIPETLHSDFAKRFDLESDTSIEDQLKTVEEEFTRIQTGLGGGQSFGKGLPLGSHGPKKEASDEEVESVMDKI